MLREKWRLVSRAERLGDNFIIITCFFAAYYGRSLLLYADKLWGMNLPFSGPGLAPIQDYYIVLMLALAAYALFLNWLGAYNSMRLSSSLQLMRLAIVASFLVFITLGSALFILKLDLSRSFIAMFCGLVGLSLGLERYAVLNVLRYWRRRGRNFRNILICGVGDQALRLAREINFRPELGIRIRAFADLGEGQVALTSQQLENFKDDLRRAGYQRPGRIIQGTKGVEKALEEYAIDEVIFTDVIEVMSPVEEMVLVCSEQGVRTTIAADLFSIGMVKSGLSYFGGMPLIHFQTPPGDRWELCVKRVIDVTASIFAILVLSPLFAMIALVIKLSSPGPIIFKQKRVGLNGRLFDLYKFRSMHIDAESQLEPLAAKNEMKGPVFKMKNDPRVTPFGRVLRRFSLDELPQLWNVLIGDMSLVGPRPPIPGEVSMYERKDRRRLSMRPGLTCTWQVSGRNEIRDFESWVRLDLEYIDNWSLFQDFVLLFRTIPAVIFGVGAR